MWPSEWRPAASSAVTSPGVPSFLLVPGLLCPPKCQGAVAPLHCVATVVTAVLRAHASTDAP